MRYRIKHGIVHTRRRQFKWRLYESHRLCALFSDRLDESGRPNDFNVPRARRRLERPIQREPRELPDVVFTHKRRGRNRPRLLHVPSEHDRDAKTNRLFGRAGWVTHKRDTTLKTIVVFPGMLGARFGRFRITINATVHARVHGVIFTTKPYANRVGVRPLLKHFRVKNFPRARFLSYAHEYLDSLNTSVQCLFIHGKNILKIASNDRMKTHKIIFSILCTYLTILLIAFENK